MSPLISLDEEDVRAILNGMVDGVITINSKGEILSFNQSAETMFGYLSNEIVGQNVRMLMPASDGDHHDEYLKRYMDSGEAHIIGIGRNVTALRKNGESFPMRLSVIEYPARIEGERWFIASCLDITLQKRQEDQLKQSMKMEALGKLTGGISHDYNNVLGIILGYAGLLLQRCPDDPIVQDYAKEIKHAGERGKDLTQKLLTFSRVQPELAESIDINEVLSENSKMLEKMLTAQFKLTLTLGDKLWPVLIDKGCLEDAILNMSINAMHAMPEGGELKFTTANVEIGALDAQVLDVEKGDYVKLSIADTGTGMSEEVRQHIFEPFYTTKADKGTGLGLSQVYGFVNKAGGVIRVYSEPGQGTCFSIYIPRDGGIETITTDDEQLDESDKYRGSGSIMIVDDDKAILELNKKILSTHGYTVMSAASAKQALELLEKEDTIVDLLLSDVIMPDMDGFELAHIISHIYPNMKIQLCSGFTEHKGKTVTNEDLYKNILHKPFTATDLLKRVSELVKS